MEDILDIIASINALCLAFQQSIPDNFRALIAMLAEEFGMEITLEVVYDMCIVCYWVYRDTESVKSAHLDECPRCSTPRHKETGPHKKPAPLMQVSCQQLSGTFIVCVLPPAQ